MEVVLIANEKGGTAKTATVLGLLNCLTALGYRVLGVDMDASGNLSMAALPEFPQKVLYDVFSDGCSFRDVICHTPIGDVAPTIRHIDIDLKKKNVDEFGYPTQNVNRKSLRNIEARWLGTSGAEYKLAAQLKGKSNNLAADYDFILIDSNPSDNLLTTNSIVAADSVIIPVAPDSTSVSGVLMLLDSFTQVQYAYRTNVKVDRLLVSVYKEDWAIDRKCINEILSIMQEHDIQAYKTRIRCSPGIKTAQSECKPVLECMHQGDGAMDFMNFALEFLSSRDLAPKVNYPGVFADETGSLIFRKNGAKYYVADISGNTATIQTKYFRASNLEDPEWREQIGKTIFFSQENLHSYLDARGISWASEEE